MKTTPSKKTKDGLKGTKIHGLTFMSDQATLRHNICFSVLSELWFLCCRQPVASDYWLSQYCTLQRIGRQCACLLYRNWTLFSPERRHSGEDSFQRHESTLTIIQLRFNPTQPHILYAAFRRCEAIYSWDLRGDVSNPICSFNNQQSSSSLPTNQKIHFDLDSTGHWMGVGNQVILCFVSITPLKHTQDGQIALFDLHEPCTNQQEPPSLEGTSKAEPSLRYKAHDGIVLAHVPAMPY